MGVSAGVCISGQSLAGGSVGVNIAQGEVTGEWPWTKLSRVERSPGVR